MKNKDYWRYRMEVLERAQTRRGLGYLKDLEKQFSTASNNIQKEISYWYERFAKNNEVSIADARKLLTGKELQELKWSIDDYIEYGRKNALSGNWMKQLENASAKVHISRLESLQLQMQQQVEVLFGNQIDDIDKVIRKAYSESYYHTAFEIQRGFNLGWSLQTLDDKSLERVLSKPWTLDNKTFSDRVWNNKQQLSTTLQTKLFQSFIKGDSPDKAINAIANQFNVSKKNAGRLVMTESAAFSSMAQKDCFKDLGVKEYEIIATLDSKTSDICQALDGKVFDMKDYEVGVTAPPFHPWCRTCTAPFFDDNFGERAARDPKTGKTSYVPSDMKYGEWYKKYTVDKYSQEQIDLIRKMELNRVRDKEQHFKYRLIYGNKIPAKLDDFQNLKYNNVREWEDFKNNKQQVLNSLDYSPKFDGVFGNHEVRSWYNSHCKTISAKIDKSKSIESQARTMYELRNKYKIEARNMMKDQKERLNLDRGHPILSFDELIAKKMTEKEITREEAIKDIIYTAKKTNKKVNEKYNLD